MKLRSILLKTGISRENNYLFTANELKKSVPTLINKPVTDEYCGTVVGKIVSAEWNVKNKAIVVELDLHEPYCPLYKTLGYSISCNVMVDRKKYTDDTVPVATKEHPHKIIDINHEGAVFLDPRYVDVIEGENTRD